MVLVPLFQELQTSTLAIHGMRRGTYVLWVVQAES